MTGPVELALSGSNPCGDVPFTVALRVAGRVHARRSPVGERGDLATACDAVCAEAGVGPAQLTALRLDLGPGSYTGLRVVVTFVRFLQRFGNVPVQAVDTLAVLARRAGPHTNRTAVLLDARRDRFHRGLFTRAGDGVLQPVVPSAALPLAEALADLRAGDRCVVPAALLERMQGELLTRGVQPVLAQALLAEELFADDLPWAAAAGEDLLPRYLMGSYVEP